MLFQEGAIYTKEPNCEKSSDSGPFQKQKKTVKRIDIGSKEDLYYARNRVQVLLWIFKKLPES
jgi:hypothetical protein